MLLHLDNITKGYNTVNNRNQRQVLKGISLNIGAGESIAILGPSGSGKTTLLNIAGSLDHPDEGRVFFKDLEITSFSEKSRDEYRNKEVGFVFQLHHLLPQCTLLENLLIPTINLKDKSERINRLERAISLMKRVGLYDFRHQKPAQLSGGECQRTAVIRAIINSPSILLADEPTGALDSVNAGNLADLLLELNKTENIALIVVTHSKTLAGKMESVYELKDGELIKFVPDPHRLREASTEQGSPAPKKGGGGIIELFS
jgi:lipoprotein-releasing system ATP-binding protein